jgi:hypothetical protein
MLDIRVMRMRMQTMLSYLTTTVDFSPANFFSLGGRIAL